MVFRWSLIWLTPKFFVILAISYTWPSFSWLITKFTPSSQFLSEYHEPFKNSVIEQIHKAQRDLEDVNFKVINKYEGDFESAMVFHRIKLIWFLSKL